MEICVVCIGKTSTQWIQEGLSHFESRIIKYIKFSSINIPDIKNVKSLSVDLIKEAEGKAILKCLNRSDFVVLMDERGKEFTSKEYADWFQRQMNSGIKRLVIIVGGPYGFSKDVYARADSLISLSKMTFTHEMAKLILTEQLYRAFTILKGEPYHHE